MVWSVSLISQQFNAILKAIQDIGLFTSSWSTKPITDAIASQCRQAHDDSTRVQISIDAAANVAHADLDGLAHAIVAQTAQQVLVGAQAHADAGQKLQALNRISGTLSAIRFSLIFPGRRPSSAFPNESKEKVSP